MSIDNDPRLTPPVHSEEWWAVAADGTPPAAEASFAAAPLAATIPAESTPDTLAPLSEESAPTIVIEPTPDPTLVETKHSRFPLWARITAGVGALAIAAGAYIATKSGDSSAPSPKAVATSGVTGGGPSIPNFSPEPTPSQRPSSSTENVSDALHPNTIKGVAVAPGDLALYKSVPKELRIDFTWQGQHWSVPKLFTPGTESLGHTYTIQDLGGQVLANYAALMTLDPKSAAYNTVLSNFTDNVRVKQYILERNEAFQAERPNDPPYTNQFLVYDTANNPVLIQDEGSDEYGNYNLAASTDIYVRPLGKDSSSLQGDPRAFVPGESQLLKNFRFGYTTTPYGAALVGVIGGDIVG